jgi:hypothetical protein
MLSVKAATLRHGSVWYRNKSRPAIAPFSAAAYQRRGTVICEHCSSGARAVLLRRQTWPKHGFEAWLEAASKRLHSNVLVVALAAKLARTPGACSQKAVTTTPISWATPHKTHDPTGKEDPQSNRKGTISPPRFARRKGRMEKWFHRHFRSLFDAASY